MDTKEICLCHCHGLKEACEGHTPGKCLVVCEHCRPVPSQLSRSGFELDNGTSGTVANTHYPPEVRDEKIARIIKEFRKLDINISTVDDSEILHWLTQTLTTLLNEE
jgi:hypothetical protein